MATVQNIAERARVFLNDTAGDRFTEAVMVPIVNECLGTLLARRPDLFLGAQRAAVTGALIWNSPVPIPVMVEASFVDMVVARCESIDDEHTESGRSMARTSQSEYGRGG